MTAEINTIHKEVIKNPIFKDISMVCLQGRVDKLLKNGKLLNKPNRDKDSLGLNRDKISHPRITNDHDDNCFPRTLHLQHLSISTISSLSVQAQIQGIQIPSSLATPQFGPNSPSHKKLPSSLLESSHLSISMDTPTTCGHVTRYSNNSNDIFQSEVIFEKLKLTKLKNGPLDDLRIEIKDIIKKELESLHINSTCPTTNYITEIESL